MRNTYNTDPSHRRGNHVITTSARAVAAVAALALAGCSTGKEVSPSFPSGGTILSTVPATPSTTEVVDPHEVAKQQLSEYTATAAKNIATTVIDRHQQDPSNPNHFVYLTKGPAEGPEVFSVTVNVPAESKIPPLNRGATVTGGYDLTVLVQKDAAGNFDPNTVTDAQIGLVSSEAFTSPDGREGGVSRGGAYFFELMQNDDHSTWSITMSQGENSPVVRVDTGFPEGQPGKFDPLSQGYLEALTGQALTAYELSLTDAPIRTGMVPPIGK